MTDDSQSPSTSFENLPKTIPEIKFSINSVLNILESLNELTIDLKKSSILHSCKCTQIQCPEVLCKSMKFVLMHTKTCKQKALGGCQLCRNIVNIFAEHSNYCDDNECDVDFCKAIKAKNRVKIIAENILKRKREENFMASRMQLMEQISKNSCESKHKRCRKEPKN